MRLPKLFRREDVEQQADAEPKGESRQEDGWSLFRRNDRTQPRQVFGQQLDTDAEDAPDSIDEYHRRYYKTFALGKAPLQLFNHAVTEPGWRATAEIDGETDEDMTDALNLWGKNCAIYAGETGHDIMEIVSDCPSGRRSKSTLFIEKVKSRESDLAGLMMLDPSTIRIHKRDAQNLLIQPEDNVGPKHPRTDDGYAAAFTQYPDSDNPISFAENEVIKLVYDPDEGNAWGNTIWLSCRENIDRLRKYLRDRGASIRLTGWPHLVYSLKNASKEQATEFADAHENEEITARDLDDDDESMSSRAGRTDYVPHEVKVEEVAPNVPDIEDAILDEIRAIFSVMPVSRFKVAYEENINQFVVEPQDEQDDQLVDDERRYLERVFEPVFQEKADELAGGEYAGKVKWRIEQPEDDNPLLRSDFDADQFQKVANGFASFASAEGDVVFNQELLYWLANIESDQFTDEEVIQRIEDATDGDQ